MLFLASVAMAQDVSGLPIPSASPAPRPSASPGAGSRWPTGFPWPTIPGPLSEPSASVELTGPPTARTRRHGVVVGMWLSPGRPWAKASTHRPPCGPPTPNRPGVDVPRRVRRSQHKGHRRSVPDRAPRVAARRQGRGLQAAGGPRVRGVARSLRPLGAAADGADGTHVLASAECSGVEFPAAWLKLAPGATMEERFIWYPARPMDSQDVRWEPLPPGIVTVEAASYYAGHGHRPPPGREHRPLHPITVTADLELTGEDPGGRPRCPS